MRGCIRKRGNSWSFRIYVGKEGEKSKQKERGGFRTKKEVEDALNKTFNDFETAGIYPENKKITLNELYCEFYDYEAKPARAYATLKNMILCIEIILNLLLVHIMFIIYQLKWFKNS